MRMSSLSRLTPHLLSALRIVAAVLFMTHGTVKLFGFPPGAQRPPLVLASLLGAAGLLETFGGGLMVLGLFARPVALVLSGEMAVAYFTQHAPNGQWPIVNGGELAVLYCFLWLFVVAAGPGPWSLDALRKRA
jgi:putative oxidoreductase